MIRNILFALLVALFAANCKGGCGGKKDMAGGQTDLTNISEDNAIEKAEQIEKELENMNIEE